jgi:CBS domain-containing protein
MIRDVYSMREETPLTEVIDKMLEKRVKRLGVLDRDRRLVGMVDRQGILHTIAGQG